MIQRRLPSPLWRLLFAITLVATYRCWFSFEITFRFSLAVAFHGFSLIGWVLFLLTFLLFHLFIYLLIWLSICLFIYLFWFFAAEFACVSSPPHFLFCSPVTLINFWPVDSAWVLPLKGAAPTHTFACWFFLVYLFSLKDILTPLPSFPLFSFPWWDVEKGRGPPIRRTRARCSGPHLGTFEPAEVLALSSKEHPRNYWVVSCTAGRHVYVFFNDKQRRAFQLLNDIL